jgi:uncharacterized membrane protein
MELTGTKKFFRFRTAPTTQAMPGLADQSARVHSIDLLRGLVMVVMALDHVRDYFHSAAYIYDPTDLNHTTLPIFFTRFITHYCAPVFMLLSGTSAYLVGIRKGKMALTKFLFTRGLWLIFLELSVVNFGWFFDIHYNNTGFLVIWALGMSMIFLSALIHLPKAAILAISLVMICGHNAFDNYHPGSVLWNFLHDPTIYQWKGINVYALYPLVPWIGVMSLGYCIGSMYEKKYAAEKRKKLLLMLGIACTVLFVALRYTNWYGDHVLWGKQSVPGLTLMSFLSLSKYPPSLLYLLATLGPAFIFLSFTEKASNWLGKRLQVIGRVPMFYYLVHIYLIHLAAMLAVALSPGHSWTDMILSTWVSFDPRLAGFGFSLGLTYLVWFGLVVVLYFLCNWYDGYKRSHKHWWLSYV